MKNETISKIIYGAFGLMVVSIFSFFGYLIFTTDTGGVTPSDLREPESNNMRISATANSEFMVWRSTNNDPYSSFEGRYSGGETVEKFGMGSFSIVESSDRYYNNRLIKNREISSVVNPDITEVTDEKNITVEETNRVTNESIDLVGGEQEVELDIEIGEGSFRLSEILFYGAEVEVQNLETEHKGLRMVEGYDIPAYEVLELKNEQMISDSTTIELKVERSNRFTGDSLYLAFNDKLWKGETTGVEKKHDAGLGYNQSDWEVTLE